MPIKSDSSSRLKAFPSWPPRRFLIFLLGMLGHFANAQSLREAEALSQSGSFLESIERYEQFIAQNPRRTYDHSVAWFGISLNYMQLGDYDAALSANQRSQTIREQLPVDDIAENYMRTGVIYLQLGLYEQALANLRRAKALPVVEPYMFALMELYMADAYTGLKNFREAEAHYEWAIESLMGETGEFSPDIVMTLHQLALMYHEQGRKSDAKETYLRALRIEEAMPQHDERLALLLNGLGESALSESRSPAARSYLLRARAALGHEVSAHSGLAARIAINLSRAALSEGDKGLAAAEVLEAQRLLFPGFSFTGFLQNPDPKRPCIDRILAAESFLLKARCLAGNIAPNDVFQYYDAALHLIQAEALAYPSVKRATLAQKLLQTLVDEAIQAAFQAVDASAPAMAFAWAERSKNLFLHLQTAAPVFPAGSPQMSPFLKWKQSEHLLRLSPDDAALATHCENAQKSYFESISAAGRQDAALLRPAGSVAEIQALLDDATALVSYYIGEKSYYIFALSRNAFKAIPSGNQLLLSDKTLTSRPTEIASGTDTSPHASLTLRKSAAAFLDELSGSSPGSFAAAAYRLYTQLLQPVAPVITGKKNLIIIPHDMVSDLPFEVFLTAPIGNADKKPYQQWPYLIRQFAVQYHLTAHSWSEPARAAGGDAVYAAWAPVFDTPETQAALAGALHRIQGSPVPLSAYGVPDLPQIPDAATEINNVAEIWNRQPGETRLFIQNDATETAVRSMAGKTKIAHFVTQGFSHTIQPRWSGMILVPSGNDDGILHLSEIQSLNWNGALCILHENLIGGNRQTTLSMLPGVYAHLRAGAGSVVASLWNGHTIDYGRLLSDFLRKRATGMPAPEALRQSKLALIKDKSAAAPNQWGGIIYFGK